MLKWSKTLLGRGQTGGLVCLEQTKLFLGDFFFISWLTDPPTQIFAFYKTKKNIFDLFYSLRCKKLPDLKKKNIFKKNNKNCMIFNTVKMQK